MAFLMAIEGIDGSGKGTQAKRLIETLTAAGHAASLVSFPRYEDTVFGHVIGDFLNGRFGQLDEVDPRIVALLFAGDRFESRSVLQQALAADRIVVCDRYVASNIAHQAAKLTGAQRAELTDWIEQIEYDVFRLPRPELVVLLDVSVLMAQQLIAAKSQRSYTDRTADLQESDAGYLQRVREVYWELAKDRPNWRTVRCVEKGKLLSIEAVGEAVWQIVEPALPDMPSRRSGQPRSTV